MITDLTRLPAATLNRVMPDESQPVSLATGFPPVVGRNPRVLVLGSLPGRASLAAGQYYAMPRNAFWYLMGRICAAGPELDYAMRLRRLERAGIALWDVLHAAERPGSLDASIVTATEQANDIAGLLEREPGIRLLAFNGRKAESLFRRHVLPLMVDPAIDQLVLPSTSPAHAVLSRDDKLAIWRDALVPHLRAR